MTGISSIEAAAGSVSSLQFQTELTARVASMQKDAVDMQGDMAMKLIEAASTTPQVGSQLNITI